MPKGRRCTGISIVPLVAIGVFSRSGVGVVSQPSPPAIAVCSPAEVVQRRGLCNATSGIGFYHLVTLPSGGGTPSVKRGGGVPGNTQDATFFFGLSVGTVAGIAPSGLHGIDYRFECKKNSEVSFVPCQCQIPSAGQSWTMCQQYTGLGRAGVMNFQVQAVALDSRTGLLATPAVATAPATFTWEVDTIAPVALIGTAGRGTAPQPCSNPAASIGQNATVFEISSNEVLGGHLECRLSNWVPRYGAFDNAMERWGTAAVQAWLSDPKHMQAQQVQRDLSVLAPNMSTVNGSALALLDAAALAVPPLSISSIADRAALLAAVELQRSPFQSCRANRSVPAVVARFDTLELGHGLKLFELRAIDLAGNVGVPSQYIWFSDLESEGVAWSTFSTPVERYTRASTVSIGFEAVERASAANAPIGGFVDHTGTRRDCALYTYSLMLNSFDITPRGADARPPAATGTLVTDLDRLGSASGLNLAAFMAAGLGAAVADGESRTYNLTVTARDVANNAGASSTRLWTVDRRAPVTVLTTVPSALSPTRAGALVNWLSDEDGVTRNISYRCTLDGGAAMPCARSSTGYTLPPLSGTPMPYSPSTPATQHTFTVTAVDEAGNAETVIRTAEGARGAAGYNSFTWFVDDRRPVTAFVSAAPPQYTATLQHTFRFTSDEATGLFDCRLTFQSATAVSSRVVPYALVSHVPLTGEMQLPGVLNDVSFADGGYNLTVTAVDGAGNRGTTVWASWRIDTQAPNVVITAPSLTPSAQRDFGTDHLTLQFTSPVDTAAGQEPVQRFQCALDCLRTVATCGGAGGAVAFPAADGSSTPVCLPHRTPRLQNFTAPPAAVVARFSGGSGGVNTAACADDVGTAANATYHDCDGGSVTYVGLQSGRHIFSVRAIDPAGNQGPPTVFGWSVDLLYPTAILVGSTSLRPPSLTRQNTANFHFSADESLVSFECRLLCAARDAVRYYADLAEAEQQAVAFGVCTGRNASFSPCSSGQSYSGLGNAIYRFQVRAIDAAGNAQSEVDVNGVLVNASTDYTWEVDRDVPEVHLVSLTPSARLDTGTIVTSAPAVTVSFATNHSGIAYQCRACVVLRGGVSGDPASSRCTPYQPCSGSGTVVRNVLVSGVGTFDLLAAQAIPICQEAITAGCSASDAHSGPGGCADGFLRLCGVPNLAYHDGALFGTAPQPCADPRARGLSAAQSRSRYACATAASYRHELWVRATDGAGNRGPEQVFTWQYDIFPPILSDFASTAASSAQSAALLSRNVPLRPVASGGSGVVSTLNLYTADRSMVLSFNASMTESYPGAAAGVEFACVLRQGSSVILNITNCSSPLHIDRTTLPTSSPYTVTGSGGAIGLMDGAYTINVQATDVVGNVGQTAAYSWVVDNAAPLTHFLDGDALSWTSAASRLQAAFTCTEPGCSFECQLEYVSEPDRQTGASRSQGRVVQPFAPCGVTPIPLTMSFIEPADTGGTFFAFLVAAQAQLTSRLEVMLAPYTVHNLTLHNDVARFPRATFVILLPDGASRSATVLATALSRFAPGVVQLDSRYEGVSRFDVRDPASGARCDCLVCNGTSATCTDSGGIPYDCPCIARYPGSGLLSLEAFQFQSVPVETFAVSGDLAAPLSSTTGYRQFRLSVRAADAAGSVGSVSSTRLFFDDAAPQTAAQLRAPTLRSCGRVGCSVPRAAIASRTFGVDLVTSEVNLGAGDNASLRRYDYRLLRYECAGQHLQTWCLGSVADNSPLWTPLVNATADFANLTDGHYRFEAAAVDKAGNRDASPVALVFSVAANLPIVELYGVRVGNGTLSAMFGGTRAAPSVRFECRVGAEGWVPCSSPWVRHDVGGAMTVEVRAVDAGGRRSATTACGRGIRVTPANRSACPTYTVPVTATLQALPAASSGDEACGDVDGPFVAALAAAVGVLFVGGVAVWWLLKRARLVDNPLGVKTRTTRAYHNPVFGQDKPPDLGGRPSVSAPSGFRHTASGSTQGYLSEPTDFRHIASGADGLISPPTDFRHVAHGSVGVDGVPRSVAGTASPLAGGSSAGGFKMVKRVTAKHRAEPSYYGANQPEGMGGGAGLG